MKTDKTVPAGVCFVNDWASSDPEEVEKTLKENVVIRLVDYSEIKIILPKTDIEPYHNNVFSYFEKAKQIGPIKICPNCNTILGWCYGGWCCISCGKSYL